ncbi:hypothetical protein GVAV_003477 [Gurleya vavrai]
MATNYRFDWKFKAPYHHKSTGCIERANQTLTNKLKLLSNFGQKDWKTQLKAATKSYNTSYNRAIRATPLSIKFNKQYVIGKDGEIEIKEMEKNKRDEITFKQKKDKYITKDIQKGKIKDKRVFKKETMC